MRNDWRWFCAAARFYASLPLELLHYLSIHCLGRRHMCTVRYNNRWSLIYTNIRWCLTIHKPPAIHTPQTFFYLHRLLINFHLKFSPARRNICSQSNMNSDNKTNSLLSGSIVESKKILHKSSLLIHPWLIFVSRSVTSARERREQIPPSNAHTRADIYPS